MSKNTAKNRKNNFLRRKVNWIRHFLRRNRLLNGAIADDESEKDRKKKKKKKTAP